MTQAVYDIAIIGGGPAGLTAGLYACRSRMRTVLLERLVCGGQVLITDIVENVPGFPEGVKGPELAALMVRQAERFGLTVQTAEISRIEPAFGAGRPFRIIPGGSGSPIEALSLIIATGARWNALGVPGEQELIGRGVSYCATCDGPLCRGKDVVVVGGGDTALGDALFLTKFARRVTVIHRRDRLRATQIIQERARKNKAIAFKLNSVVTKIAGETKVTGVAVRDVVSAREETIAADAVFVLVGVVPNAELAKGIVDLDEKGYIIADRDMRTSREGVFACGDVRKKALRQIVTALGEGAAAAFSAEQYVESIRTA